MKTEAENSFAPEPKAFDRIEAARRLGISIPTLDRELAKNRIPHFRVGRRVLFTDDLLTEYITRRTVQTA